MSSKDNFIERRRSSRHSLKIPVYLRVWGSPGPSRNGKSLDISERGALLETDLPLELGTLLELRIRLPEEITGQPTTEWRCRSRVVHVALASSLSYPVKAGVHFDWLDGSRK